MGAEVRVGTIPQTTRAAPRPLPVETRMGSVQPESQYRTLSPQESRQQNMESRQRMNAAQRHAAAGNTQSARAPAPGENPAFDSFRQQQMQAR